MYAKLKEMINTNADILKNIRFLTDEDIDEIRF